MSNKIYTALNDIVFIEETQKTETKQGGLIVPDSLNDDFLYGEVISVAEGYWGDRGTFIPACVVAGDKVAVNKTSTTKVTLNNQKLLMVRMADIIAKEIDGMIEETTDKQ